MEMNEQIDLIIAKKLAGEASADDERVLESWLAADNRHQAVYDGIATAWQKSDELFGNVRFATDAAWKNISSKTVDKIPAKSRTIAMPQWVKYATGIAAILLIGLIIMRPGTDSDMVTLLADASNSEVILPDESKVTLRKGSKITYPRRFDAAQRNVSLEGEAFFEVQRDESKPFVIDAQSVSVTVLGTSFDVKSGIDEAGVTVATGKVSVKTKNVTPQEVLLTPGEKGILKGGRLKETTITNNNYLFWKTGILEYNNQELSAIADEISHYYQTILIFDSSMPEDAKRQFVTISFKNQTIETIISELCMVANCTWQQKDNQYVIMPK